MKLPGPTRIARQSMEKLFAELEVNIVAAFAGVFDPDAVRLELADLCFRRAAGAGLTDAPAPVVAKPKVRR